MEEQPLDHHPWLGQLLKSNFKKFSCKNHGFTLNHFCTDCLGLLICEKCAKCNEHRGHGIIRVFQSSRQDGIQIKNLDNLLDVSQIHPYVINGAKIVYIYRRLYSSNKDKAKLGGCSRASGRRKFCVRCGFELQSKKEEPDSKFCSIECKYKSVCGRRHSPSPQQIDETDTGDEMNNDEIDMVDEIDHEKSLRRRPRKAYHPSRSPFF
ncbi:hypothetical protein SLEP1_g12016 [Rubroshorea leprosula]|nr:hypothetical protein SLEP1_g12016 [Rubroshorea leprosula]